MHDNVAMKYAVMWLAYMSNSSNAYPMCSKLTEDQKAYVRAAIARGKMTAQAAKRDDYNQEYCEKELFAKYRREATQHMLGNCTMDAIFGMAYWWAYSKAE